MNEELSAGPTSDGQAADDDLRIEDLTTVLGICQKLTPAGRLRLIETITTFFGLSQITAPRSPKPEFTSSMPSRSSRFSDDAMMAPKEFILQKQPHTDVERVACIGYYLTHYRDTPQFKTLDVSKLNTEAAQPKFSNAAIAVSNAVKMRYLIALPKGNKQLSAAGELFVEALPDRDKARATMASTRPRKRTRRSDSLKNSENEENESG